MLDLAQRLGFREEHREDGEVTVVRPLGAPSRQS